MENHSTEVCRFLQEQFTMKQTMKKRYLYALLFAVPGLFIAGMISVILLGAFAGILWLWVFGDNPWPSSTEAILSVLFVLVFLILWVGFIGLGYGIGKRLETNPTLNKNHILISLALTITLIVFILLQQWSIGNIGPKSDSVLCSDYCIQQGYFGSGMPPANSGDRSCSCYDASGKEALKVPLDTIDPSK